MDLYEEKNIAPMLIVENKPPFDHPNWIYELKFDGVRCVAYLYKSGVVLRNKRNKDVTAIYPELAGIHKQIKRRCILDGEVFCLVGGKPNFEEIRRRALMTNPYIRTVNRSEYLTGTDRKTRRHLRQTGK